MEILNPPGWPRPKGYANGIAVSGRMVFVAGMVGWTPEEKFETDDFAGQFRQALENIRAVLAEGGAKPEHVVRMTVFLGDKQDERSDALAEYLEVLDERTVVAMPIAAPERAREALRDLLSRATE